MVFRVFSLTAKTIQSVMQDTLLLPAPEIIRKPVWRRWKWIGLVVFITVLILQPWLPSWLEAIGLLYGTVVLLNLGYQIPVTSRIAFSGVFVTGLLDRSSLSV